MTLVIIEGGLLSCSKPYITPKPNQEKTDKVPCKDEICKKTTDFNEKQKIENETHNVILQIPIFEDTAEKLKNTVEKVILDTNEKLVLLVHQNQNTLTFESTLVALENIYYDIKNVSMRVGLISSVTKDKSLKEEARRLEVVLEQWFVEAEANKEVFKLIQNFANTNPKLEGEDLRLLTETLKSFKRIGFFLNDSEKENLLKEYRKILSEKLNKINQNIDEANAEKLIFNLSELDGLTEDQLQNLNKESENQYSINLGVYFQYLTIAENAKNEATRKKAYFARNSRAQNTNKKLMEEVILLRSKIANLLGYDSWADYSIEDKMALNAKNAINFESKLIKDLESKYQSEIQSLLKYKKEETKKQNEQLHAWDTAYYIKIKNKKEHDLDTDQLKKYFEYNRVLKGMLDLFSELMSLKIEFIQAPYTWDEKVQLLKISDLESGTPLSYLFLDMFPRPDTEKYGHFASFTIKTGRLLSSGFSERPIGALVCNFPLPQEGQPALLSMDDVETLFHEFGHALHTGISQVKFSSFWGTNVPRDFVEAPSQMLEYWVNNKKVLDRFAVNYQDPEDKISQEILNKIKASQNSTIAISYRRQLSFGYTDLMLHTQIAERDNFDIIEFSNKYFNSIYLPYPEGSSMITSFGHLFGGYDAGYYGYAWADSIAADLASLFEASPDGFLDKELSLKLRKEIYEKGSSRDINDSIYQFLGRETNNKAFLKKLGIK